MAPADDIDRLRAELEEWRRRAEVAEAIAVERLARAESAEQSLRTAEAALSTARTRAGDPSGAAGQAEDRAPAAPGETVRPATLRERWRRYTETIN